jgi:hypothetical protein
MPVRLEWMPGLWSHSCPHQTLAVVPTLPVLLCLLLIPATLRLIPAR